VRHTADVRSLAALIVALALVACSNESHSTSASAQTPAVSESTPSPSKEPAVDSPALAINLSSTRGGPGEQVRIEVTGCDDPTGKNHAVSFNDDAQNVSARNDPNTVRMIVAVQDGSTLRATYTIQRADVTGGVGMFYVQCQAAVRSAPFTVVNG